jgi:hypothetical protein
MTPIDSKLMKFAVFVEIDIMIPEEVLLLALTSIIIFLEEGI